MMRSARADQSSVPAKRAKTDVTQAAPSPLDGIYLKFTYACEKEREREALVQQCRESKRNVLCKTVEMMVMQQSKESLYTQLEECAPGEFHSSGLVFADYLMSWINEERFPVDESDERILFLLDQGATLSTPTALCYLSEIASQMHVVDSCCDLQHIIALLLRTLPHSERVVELWTENFDKFSKTDLRSCDEFTSLCVALSEVEGWRVVANTVRDFMDIFQVVHKANCVRNFN